MRILMDFEMNNDAETFNGIRVLDIEEYEATRLTPIWESGSDSNDIPDDLCIELYHIGNPTQEFATTGYYNLDGTKEVFEKALNNYNKVVNQLLTKGYAKISDFENVSWL